MITPLAGGPPPRMQPRRRMRRGVGSLLTLALATLGMAGVATLTVTGSSSAVATTFSAVSVPGDANSAMGCSANWQPECPQAQLALRQDKIWGGTFTIPAGSYNYKIATNNSWDVSFGGPAGDVPYNHPGGSISFYFDPVAKVFQNTSQGEIFTLPGNFQKQLGCTEDWAPEQLCSWLTDMDGDGIYTFSTSSLATGSYEVKVAAGMSWGTSWGQDGVAGGANIPFQASAGKMVKFSFNKVTHVLKIDVEDPPLPGTGQLAAYWVTADMLAWPPNLGSQDPNATYAMYHSENATLSAVSGTITGGPSEVLERVPAGLPASVTARFPHLKGYQALRLVGQSRAAVKQILTHQLWVAQSAGGAMTAVTGVQIPGVLDDLYAQAAADVALGVTFTGQTARGRVWAPTAQAVFMEVKRNNVGSPFVAPASFDSNSGVWSIPDGTLQVGDAYRWLVKVYAPSTGRIESNLVTDPYSTGLNDASTWSRVIDLSASNTKPALWLQTPAPIVAKAVDRAIYELHVRDFSIGDATVPENMRGTYMAFTQFDSSGMKHLANLAKAGMNTVHLLPTFDIASIPPIPANQTKPNCDLPALTAANPAGPAQQACVGAQRETDGFNWGYDPLHFFVPEGSYATGQADPATRTAEFRAMVGGLHKTGLQVVLDQVFNHTAESGQGPKSILDRIVPGYYHRLNAVGNVETSTCCQNVATEHDLAQKLMVDSVVMWARDYHVDGFRFDLMGHHSVDNMKAVRAGLDKLTLEKDGVNGKAIYLYGEGWNFGEVANNARFKQASQGNLGGLGIGTFNDRLRDAVHGGSPVESKTIFDQGFGTGLGTDPNGKSKVGKEALGHLTDLVKLGLAGNLRDFAFTTHDGQVRTGAQVDYSGAPAGYADQPDEVVNYVDAHDNETLYDLAVFKLPVGTSMADRVRMNTLMQATATLSQSLSFWHAGGDLLRSKSLDRDSYDSGDWFNRIDWTASSNTYASGLPGAWANESKWPDMAPLLANPALKPDKAAMTAASARALDLLRIRSEVDLLHMGSADLIKSKVTFPGSGPSEPPATIAMLIDDTVGARYSSKYDAALVLFNASPAPVTRSFPNLVGRNFQLVEPQAKGSDPVVANVTWNAAAGSVTIPARSFLVFTQPRVAPPVPPTPTPTPSDPLGPQGSGGLAPGSATATRGGSAVPVVVSNRTSTGVATLNSAGWSLQVRGATNKNRTLLIADRSVQLVAGQRIEVSGTGFTPNMSVKLWMFSAAVPLGVAQTDAGGRFTVVLTVPANMSTAAHTLQVNSWVTPAVGQPMVVASTNLGLMVNRTTAKATAVSKASKLRIISLPKCRSAYRFTVQKQVTSSGNRGSDEPTVTYKWKKVGSYSTRGSTQSRTLNLPKGTYRAKVSSACSVPATTTDPATLKR